MPSSFSVWKSSTTFVSLFLGTSAVVAYPFTVTSATPTATFNGWSKWKHIRDNEPLCGATKIATASSCSTPSATVTSLCSTVEISDNQVTSACVSATIEPDPICSTVVQSVSTACETSSTCVVTDAPITTCATYYLEDTKFEMTYECMTWTMEMSGSPVTSTCMSYHLEVQDHDGPSTVRCDTLSPTSGTVCASATRTSVQTSIMSVVNLPITHTPIPSNFLTGIPSSTISNKSFVTASITATSEIVTNGSMTLSTGASTGASTDTSITDSMASSNAISATSPAASSDASSFAPCTRSSGPYQKVWGAWEDSSSTCQVTISTSSWSYSSTQGTTSTTFWNTSSRYTSMTTVSSRGHWGNWHGIDTTGSTTSTPMSLRASGWGMWPADTSPATPVTTPSSSSSAGGQTTVGSTSLAQITTTAASSLVYVHSQGRYAVANVNTDGLDQEFLTNTVTNVIKNTITNTDVTRTPDAAVRTPDATAKTLDAVAATSIVKPYTGDSVRPKYRGFAVLIIAAIVGATADLFTL